MSDDLASASSSPAAANTVVEPSLVLFTIWPFVVFLPPPMQSVQVSVLFFFYRKFLLVSVKFSQIFLSEQEENLFLQYQCIFKIPEHVVKKAKQEGNFFIPDFNKNINLQYSPLVKITHFFLFLYLRYLSVSSLILMSKYKLFK